MAPAMNTATEACLQESILQCYLLQEAILDYLLSLDNASWFYLGHFYV